MRRSSLFRLPNAALIQEFTDRLARSNADTAELLLFLAEIDRRKLHRPAGYSSIYKYCIGHFHLSESAAYKRILAARLIRKYPAVYEAVAEGRVHLSGLLVLVGHLRPENADELLAAAVHKSRAQIEKLLAERFPKRDVPARIVQLPPVPSAQLASAPGAELSPATSAKLTAPPELSPGTVFDQVLTPGDDALETRGDVPMGTEHAGISAAPATLIPPAAHSSDRPRVTPLSASRYAVQFTMDEASHALLCEAQELLGHQVSPGDLAAVFGRALKVYVEHLRRAKFAATQRPQAHPRRTREDSRHVPARVKRTVWERDGGQCTFVSESGHRCEERTDLEFDHVLEYARGGEATLGGIRLRCPAHNQLTAEETFGAEFMRQKREHAAESRNLAKAGLSDASRPNGASEGAPRVP